VPRQRPSDVAELEHRLDDVAIRVGGRRDGDGRALGLVRDVWVDPSGTAWAATYGAGLFAIRDGQVRELDRRTWLCENVVSRVVPDALGGLWLNGNRGVARLERAEVEAWARGERDHVTCAILEAGEGNGNAGEGARDGRIWFPTINGVVVVDPSHVRAPVAPTAYLAGATLGGRPVEDGAELAPPRSDLRFDLGAISFTDPTGITFRYRLFGYDAAWVEGVTSGRYQDWMKNNYGDREGQSA
jgi:hypothetical protein